MTENVSRETFSLVFILQNLEKYSIKKTPYKIYFTKDGLLTLKFIFSGQVQGVGFRYTTKNISQDFNIKGYVKNLPDGRVEVICAGDLHEISAFVAKIQRTMAKNITTVEREELCDTLPLAASFEIRR